MTAHLDAAVAAITTFGSALLGSQVARSAGHFMAETANYPMPEWLQWVIGPAGALVGLVIALKWMAGRLNKAEEKIDRREEERDEDRKRLIEVLAENSNVIKEAKEAYREVVGAISKCKGNGNQTP